MIEYEIKLKVSHDLIKLKLEELSAEFIHAGYNNDTYFNHPSRKFDQTDEALRIREDSEGWKLTYKGPKIDDKSKSREEIEIDLPSNEIESILSKLNFSISGEVRKTREIWKLEKFTISLDSIIKLGEFIEVEIMGSENDKVEIVEQLHQIVKKLGLNPQNQIRKSYLELVMNG